MSDDVISVLFDEENPPAWRLEPPRDPDLVCDGIPTDSVLGLLCALGTLRTLDRAWPEKDVRMAWMRAGGAWKPCLWVCEGTLSGDDPERQRRVVQALGEHLTEADAPWWNFADDPKMPCETFLGTADEANRTTSHHDRDFADWLVAYGCEGLAQSLDDDIHDSDLSLMRRARRQLFIKSMRELAACTTQDHIHRALFRHWQYVDNIPYLRLDYRDDRDMAAYQAHDPLDTKGKEATSPILTERGANRLAAEAIPFFATAPSARDISTVGFFRGEAGTFFRFPLWDRPATVLSVRYLLGHPELTEEVPDATALRPLGVVTVVQARRNQTAKGGRSFLPAEQLW